MDSARLTFLLLYVEKQTRDFSGRVVFKYFFSSRFIMLPRFNILAFGRVRKISKSEYSLRSVCPSVLPSSVSMEQLVSESKDFHEKFNVYVLQTSAEKIQFD
jgi:hypothetical protein